MIGEADNAFLSPVRLSQEPLSLVLPRDSGEIQPLGVTLGMRNVLEWIASRELVLGRSQDSESA